MKLQVDGDIIAHKCAYISEDKSTQEALDLVFEYLKNSTDHLTKYLLPTLSDTADMSIHLSGNTSFRKEIDPSYKDNRKNKPKPRHLESIREYLAGHFGATFSRNGYEADDSLGYLQTKSEPMSSVILSIDKDLLQIPGYHYNLDNQTLTYVLPYQGIKQFYLQMLIGDPVDNVKGVDGIGKVNAEKLLKGVLTEEQMFYIVKGQYRLQEFERSDTADNEEVREIALQTADERMLKNSKLLWILRADKKNPVEEYYKTIQR